MVTLDPKDCRSGRFVKRGNRKTAGNPGRKKRQMPSDFAHVLSRRDVRILTEKQRCFFKTFERVRKGAVGRMIDGEFESFSIPTISRPFPLPPSPANVVLGMDGVTIRMSEMHRYKRILARAKSLTPDIGRLQAHIDEVNEQIRVDLENTMTIYRGMAILELVRMARNGGKVGAHKRIKYAAKNDFVSCSIDVEIAMFFTFQKKTGVVVEFDVSSMKRSDYAPVRYSARRLVYVTPRGRSVYNPYEQFCGSQSGVYMRECEIHIKSNTKPPIKRVIVLGYKRPAFKRKLERTVSMLEGIQRREITIKYFDEYRPI